MNPPKQTSKKMNEQNPYGLCVTKYLGQDSFLTWDKTLNVLMESGELFN